ncbi:MAG: Uma2 family endonuclease [Gammaproteobacteria bacterium]|nr:Uma2 family endonuclease [Gammaproteobacteria bacterium]
MSLAIQQSHYLSHDDYFLLEQQQDQRYEYIDGEVYAMAGGSESHALISMNAGAALVGLFRQQPCRVYGADMKLHIDAMDKFCYPDISLLCQQGRRNPRFIEGPSLLVEVLSDSTESYDRGLKFEHYRQIPELQLYLLLDQHRPHAELFVRQDSGLWLLSEYSGLQAQVPLAPWGLQLELAEVYREVEFTPMKPVPEIGEDD